MCECQLLVDVIDGVKQLEIELFDNIEFIELGEIEEDDEVIVEVEVVIVVLVIIVVEKELEVFLDGEVDSNDIFLEINLGVGGIESCDWVLMLVWMYVCWVEKCGYMVEL